jgi:hypothetical protein
MYNAGAGASSLRFTLINENGGWFIDDQDLGCSSTSIYNPAYDQVTSTTATLPPQPASCSAPDSNVPVIGSGAADPATALKEVINLSGTNQFCQSRTAQYESAPCPVTQRFADRLDANPFSAPAGGAAAICRCQNAPQQTVTLLSATPTWAYVSYNIGAGAPPLRFTVISVNGSWYVDDQDLGCSSTSIYNPLYDAVTSSSATPGQSPPTSC